jgi:capsular polysaccharide export protein
VAVKSQYEVLRTKSIRSIERRATSALRALDCSALVDRGWRARRGVLVTSSAASILLNRNDNLLKSAEGQAAVRLRTASAALRSMGAARQPFLRIPPFPGGKLRYFEQLRSSNAAPASLADEIRRRRVGGTYWGAQPTLPADYVLIRSISALTAARQIARSAEVILWSSGEDKASAAGCRVIRDECDPWHMLVSARGLFVEGDDELQLIASLCDVPVYVRDTGTDRYAIRTIDAVRAIAQAIPAEGLANPFTMEPMNAVEAVRLCGFWRELIDSNREISAGIGFAFWKQKHVAPLLWDGGSSFRFLRNANRAEGSGAIAVWRSKVQPGALAAFEREGAIFVEVEDGFLRSRGLGADCIPPLSITVDRAAAHFDPTKASELESILQNGDFDDSIIGRAQDLRRLIVKTGLSKYELGGEPLLRPAADRRHILVPGQVEDDRAVILGGCGLVSNLDLLKRVRAQAPDAYILYKPHPDVLAGHRRGMLSRSKCLQYADEIVGELPISSLISMVDEVHVNTSLAGFEALLRGKPVTTHGIPFYAGWGLTSDLGPVPARRTARRTLDELVAATLLLYPRYLDPVTGLPCPAEVVVPRLTNGCDHDPGILVRMRRFQGKLARRLGMIVQ